jgi:hypothetical protein
MGADAGLILIFVGFPILVGIANAIWPIEKSEKDEKSGE